MVSKQEIYIELQGLGHKFESGGGQSRGPRLFPLLTAALKLLASQKCGGGAWPLCTSCDVGPG